MDPVSAFRPAFDADPLDAARRLIAADRLDDDSDPRAAVLRAAADIGRHVHDVAFPDRYPSFWAKSDGWRFVAEELAMVTSKGHPTTEYVRFHAQRLFRGDVPLDTEHLEPTLRLQYDLQLYLLQSLDLVEVGEDGMPGITALDEEHYPVPAFDDVLAKLHSPELQLKICQGFDTLLLVPFGLPLLRLLDAWRRGLKRNTITLRRLDDVGPLWVWNGITQDALVYHSRSFDAVHGGRTKAQALATGRAWDVLLVEGALPNLPREGEERTIGGRAQLPCGRTPEEYLVDLRSRREEGLTPEGYVLQFLDALERQGQVLDTDTYSYLTGAYLPAARVVPIAHWYSVGQVGLYDVDPGRAGSGDGVRAAVRVM